MVLTDRRSAARPLLEVVAAAVDGGARAVLLRERDLPVAARARLADAIAGMLAPVDGLLVLAGYGSSPAVHLSAREPMPTAPDRPGLVGRSCHDAAEVAAADRDGCDWVTVSPVHPTASKPGYGPALGPGGLAALVAVPGAPPAYALGGVTAGNAATWLAAGAYGVAVMGELMRAADPARGVADLLDQLPEAQLPAHEPAGRA